MFFHSIPGAAAEEEEVEAWEEAGFRGAANLRKERKKRSREMVKWFDPCSVVLSSRTLNQQHSKAASVMHF